jgi:hypothetical protein
MGIAPPESLGTKAMKTPEIYRLFAAECRHLVDEAQSPQRKATLVKMAETWESLAKDASQGRMISFNDPNASNTK